MAASTTTHVVADEIVPNSPLLKLPGEIRNQICSLALSTYPRETVDLSPASEDRRINQLQWVCRQLHQETRLLKCKLNPVEIHGSMVTRQKTCFLSEFGHFRDDKDPMLAKTVFLELTRALGPPRLDWIQSLTISNRVPVGNHWYWEELKEMASTMVHLTDVLENNPALRVKYKMHAFCKADLLEGQTDDKRLDFQIMLRAILVSTVIRSETLVDMWPLPTSDGMAGLQANTRGYVRMEPAFRAVAQAPLQTKQLWLDKIKFFPDPDIVTTQQFVLGPTPHVWAHRLHAEGKLQLWAALLKRWMEEGM